MRHSATLFSVFMTAFSIAAFSACSGQSTDKVSKDLAGKLTDSFNFDNGKKVSAQEPLEHKGNPAYPQVTGAELTPTLFAGQAFELHLFTDFANDADITGAVVAVEHNGVYAGFYIDVTAKIELVGGKKLMKLTGRMSDDVGFDAENFIVKLAFHRSDGQIGNYYEWAVSVYNSTFDGGVDSGTDAGPILHTLTVTVGDGGSVTLEPSGGVYPEGTVVTATATSSSGWRFDHWEGDVPPESANPVSIVMSGDKIVTAVFGEYPAPAPGGGGGLAVTDQFDQYLALRWTAGSDPYTPQDSLEYLLLYSTADNIGTVGDALANGTQVGDWARAITGRAATVLAPNTHYYFNVLLRNGAGKMAAYTAAEGTTGDSPMAVSDGEIRAIVPSPTGGTLYIGGIFTRLGRPLSGGAILDGTTGAIAANALPGNIAGIVKAVASDGMGGWYIGGDFDKVNGTERPKLAHLSADGLLYDWNPNPDAAVTAIAVSGSTIYAGGGFTYIGAQSPQLPRNNIAALDAVTGEATDWDPNADSNVNALAVGGSVVYVGGTFSNIGGQTRYLVAALDASTGKATGWDAGAVKCTSTYMNPSVESVVLSGDGSTVYVGGCISQIGGQTRNLVASIKASDAKATDWNPNPNGGGGPMDMSIVRAIVPVGSGPTAKTYIAGKFVNVGAQSPQVARNNLAEIDASGNATSWDPAPNDNVNAIALSADGKSLYAGGNFYQLNDTTVRNFLAAIDTTTGTATSWDPDMNSYVLALAITGSTVYAGGEFNSMGGFQRHGIAAVDGSTGSLTSWDPNSDGNVYAMALNGTTLYTGGSFTAIGAQSPQPTRNNLAAIETDTGNATSWDPNPDGSIYAIAVGTGVVYAGGYFTTIGSQIPQVSRVDAAAIDVASGNATSWNPNPNDAVLAIAVGGTFIYLGGNFTTLNTQLRNRICEVNTSLGLPTGWNPSADSSVYNIVVIGGTVYTGGVFSTIGSQIPPVTRNMIAAIDAASGNATSWDPNAGGSVIAIAFSADGLTTYIGGSFNTVNGATERNYIAAIDTATGTATSWDPNANGPVSALAVVGSTVYVGGSFTSIGGKHRKGFAALDAATGTAR